jgi:hypothetical protein
MKRFLIGLLALALLVPSIEARRTRAKAGEVKKQVFTDDKYDFSMKILDSWSYSVNDEDDPNRLVLSQDKPGIPPDYLDAPDYTMYPKLVLFVGKTKLSSFAFLDSLLSSSYDSDTKKEAMKDIEILRREPNRDDVISKKRSTVGIDDQRGVLWTGQANYMQEVSTSASDLGGKRVYGAYTGAIWVVKFGDNNVMVASVISEQDFFDAVLQEAAQMMGTITFDASKKAEEKKEKGDDGNS